MQLFPPTALIPAMAAAGDDQSGAWVFDPEELPPLVCIAGAPRCGTTSLAEFMRAHPDICFSRIKEPHFYSRFDLIALNDDQLRSTVSHSYVQRFFHRTGQEAVLAEGSVSYFYAAERMRPLLRIWPDAKFIVMLRDPLQLLPSLHQRLLYLGDETVTDFARAWRLNGDRAAGRKIPPTCVDPRMLRYDEVGRLGKYLSEFLKVVGRNRCLLILHEDFAADPSAVYHRVQEFIGVRAVEPPEQRLHRASTGFRFGWLQRLLYRPPIVTRAILGRTPKPDAFLGVRDRKSSSFARFARNIRRQLVRWNQVPARPAVVPLDVRREISELLADDIELLAALIGRNLDHWLGGALRARNAMAEPLVRVGVTRVRQARS
jgi:hypothetical protein